MLRGLLAERFKLKVHGETRDTPIYALVLARSDGKLGPKLSKSDRRLREDSRGAARGWRQGRARAEPAGLRSRHARARRKTCLHDHRCVATPVPGGMPVLTMQGRRPDDRSRS